ncbi:hypothetical protein AB0B25_31480 [Nocardia sp. NPDC049190]|uniref:hypothetical protein n=1 Tax=Nocardia sp. NPDC049190 TaxID=3155650 RepID=UPI0033D2AB56
MTELLYSEPFSSKLKTRGVYVAEELSALAVELLDRYKAEKDIFPGIEIRRGSGESLAIAIAPIGWALVHTNADFAQHSTRDPEVESETTCDIRWEEPGSLPVSWFISEALALTAITQWMAGGGLTTDITWSQECA